MKHLLIGAILSTCTLAVSAQQLQSSSFHDLQTVIHNPAFAGTGTNNFVGINYRTQFSTVDGGPKTATVFGSFALPKQKLGIGGYIFNDKTGVTTKTGVSISVAKHIIFADKSTLSLAIENRLQQTSYDQAKLSATLGSDPAIGNVGNSINYDAGFGVLYIKDKLQIGLSAAQLLQSKQKNYNGALVRSQEGRLYRHFYMNGSYQIDLDQSSSITPHFLLIYLPNAPFEYWVGGKYKYEDLFSVGLGFSKAKNVNVTMGVGLTKELGLSYAFTLYNNPFDNIDAFKPTHEFMLRYNLKKK